MINLRWLRRGEFARLKGWENRQPAHDAPRDQRLLFKLVKARLRL